MISKFQKIIDFCSVLNEKETCNVYGDNYKIQDIINFARKFDPTLITLHKALEVIDNMELEQELRRVLKNKDTSYNY